MGILKNITGRINRRRENTVAAAQETENIVMMKQSDMDMHDHAQRERYVQACLQQLGDASRELETLDAEYNLVTSKLTDMEEIDAMPPELKEQLCGIARQMVDIDQNQKQKKERKSLMSDAAYAHMERIACYMPEGIEKLKQAESYQKLIKNDLGRLEGEKQAYLFRKNEVENAQKNMKGMTIICLGAMLTLFVLLSVIHTVLQMDVQIGYVIAVLIAAVAVTIVFVKYGDSQREMVRIEKAMNKLVLLHNTVKIRYVNNTNLLEYLYMKYEVENVASLQKLWQKYQQERKIREEEAQLRQEMDDMQSALVKLLHKCKIQDPNVWIHQAQAIYDNKEMVELRHGLIIRRQKLRKQMEYNAKVAQDAQDEIKDLVTKYPEYAQKILEMVSEYETEIA